MEGLKTVSAADLRPAFARGLQGGAAPFDCACFVDEALGISLALGVAVDVERRVWEAAARAGRTLPRKPPPQITPKARRRHVDATVVCFPCVFLVLLSYTNVYSDELHDTMKQSDGFSFGWSRV